MTVPGDPPPPPLAADVALSSLSCQLASENICESASKLLSLIRSLRLSLLVMDEETIGAEEHVQVEATLAQTQAARERTIQIEQELMRVRSRGFQ